MLGINNQRKYFKQKGVKKIMKSNISQLTKAFMRLTGKLSGLIPALALVLAVQSASATCFFCLHQPDVPEELM